MLRPFPSPKVRAPMIRRLYFPRSAVRPPVPRPARTASVVGLVLVAAVGPSARDARAGEPASFFERRVTLDLWGATFPDAVHALREQTGLVLESAVPPVRDEPALDERPLYLSAKDIPLRTALELLARALQCRYHEVRPGRVRFVAGYDWVHGDESPRSLLHPHPRRDWMAAGDTDTARADQRLLEFGKAVPLFEPMKCAFRIVEYPLGGGQFRDQLEGALPPRHHQLVTDVLRLAANPPGPLVVPPPPARTAAPLRVEGKIPARYVRQSPRDVIDDLTLLTRFAVGFDHDPFRDAPPPAVSLGGDAPPSGTVALADVRDTFVHLAQALGLRGAFSPYEGVVWLTADFDGWRDRPSESRELLWATLEARAFPAADALAFPDAAAVRPDGDALVRQLRQRVHPGRWRDPLTALVYNPRHRSLVAVAPADTLDALARELARHGESVRQHGRWPAPPATENAP